MATALLGRRPTMIVSTMPMLIHPTSANINGRARCRVTRKSRRHSSRETWLGFAIIFLVTISIGTRGCCQFFVKVGWVLSADDEWRKPYGWDAGAKPELLPIGSGALPPVSCPDEESNEYTCRLESLARSAYTSVPSGLKANPGVCAVIGMEFPVSCTFAAVR